eukprot:8639553-Prorocentrum_lima.AAC.1
MTSSLVGSEMCIRDSNRPKRSRVTIVTHASLPELSICQCQQPLDQHYPPVSYTHLTLPTICSV